jgi:hypothetical protein
MTDKFSSSLTASGEMIANPRWFVIPIRGSQMQRINTSYFYRLATKLIPLRHVTQGKTVLDVWGELYGAQQELWVFLSNQVMPPHTSEGPGRQLYELIQKLAAGLFVDPPTEPPTFHEIELSEVNELSEALQKFEISLQSDFAVRDTFICSPKAAYSTTILAESGETLISQAAHALVGSMKKDLHDAARCMAFELPTAAAFHFFRAVEAMVVAYGEFLRQKPFTQSEKKKGLGGIANLLKEKSLGVDVRITNAVEQLALLHRNPTMHPEWHISTTEILVTVGMVVSVIETVALDWNRRTETPQKSLSEFLPEDSRLESSAGELDLSAVPKPTPLESEGAKHEKKPKKRVAKPRKEPSPKA